MKLTAQELRNEYCKINGIGKFNNFNLNNYTDFLEMKVSVLTDLVLQEKN